jgi:hypothetical protein
MNEEITKIYNSNNDIWGLPQSYKNIKFYPIKVQDQDKQELFYRVFAQPKQYINKKEIVKLSYLKFILYAFGDTDIVQNNIISILQHIAQTKNVKIEMSPFDRSLPITLENIIFRIVIDDVNFDEQEFDNIREIVLQQNGTSIEYVEDYRPDLEKKMEFFTFGNDIDFTDEVFTFSISMKQLISDIGKYTIYQLQQSVERLFVSRNYDMLKPLEVSGQIKLKNGEIKSYLYHMGKKSRYEQLLTPVEGWMDKNKEVFGKS